HHVVIEHAQRAEIHILGIVIIPKRKMPVGGKPPMIRVITFIRFNCANHDKLQSSFILPTPNAPPTVSPSPLRATQSTSSTSSPPVFLIVSHATPRSSHPASSKSSIP